MISLTFLSSKEWYALSTNDSRHIPTHTSLHAYDMHERPEWEQSPFVVAADGRWSWQISCAQLFPAASPHQLFPGRTRVQEPESWQLDWVFCRMNERMNGRMKGATEFLTTLQWPDSCTAWKILPMTFASNYLRVKGPTGQDACQHRGAFGLVFWMEPSPVGLINGLQLYSTVSPSEHCRISRSPKLCPSRL